MSKEEKGLALLRPLVELVVTVFRLTLQPNYHWMRFNYMSHLT